MSTRNPDTGTMDEKNRHLTKELRKTTRLLESVLNAIPDVIGLQDSNHRIKRYNAAGYAMIGKRPEDVHGLPCYEQIGRREQCSECATREALQTKKPARVERYEENLDAWFDIRAYPILDEQGQVETIIEHLRDITPEKRTLQKLSDSEARYRTLFEAAIDAIFLMRGTSFIACNARAVEMFGLEPDDLIGQNPADLSPEKQPNGSNSAEAAMLHIRAAQEGRAQLFSWFHRRADGSSFPAEVSFNRLVVENETLLQAIVRDVTEKHRAERERKALEVRLRHQQQLEAIGTLAAGVAHEINNPMTGVINYAQLLENRLDGEEKLKHYAQRIVQEGQRVSQIVRNLLALSRQEGHTPTAANLVDIIEDATALVRTVFRKDDVQLETDYEKDLPAVRCLARQVQQIVMNLLTNARDAVVDAAMETRGARTVRIVVRRRTDDEGRSWIRTSVEDQGLGVPSHIRERIFEPFFTTKSREHGTGLGLSISYGLAKDNGGCLSVESEEGVGSRFHLDLPLASQVPKASKNEGDKE